MKEKGILYDAIKFCIKKGKSVPFTQQYIYVKHKISIGKKALLVRIKNNHKK